MELESLCLIGLCFVVCAWWGDQALLSVGLPASHTVGEVASHPVWAVVRQVLPISPALLLAVVSARKFSWLARLGLRELRGLQDLAIGVSVSVSCSWVLDLWGLWPWHWRLDPEPNLRFIGALLAGRSILAFGIWVIASGVLLPVLEEVIFRFGLVQIIQRHSGSSHTGVLGSAVLFALAHIGVGVVWSAGNLRNALWALLFGTVLGYTVVKDPTRLSLAVGAHCGRSLLEMFSLFHLAPVIQVVARA